jgi:hypothetical protein
MILGGCATTSSNSINMSKDEFDRVKKGETVIVNQRQSHGLVGDMLHKALPHP